MQADLAATQARNPGYSLRAFSRRIGLYSSTVSEILSGRRPVTRKMAARILSGMGTAPDQAQEILQGLGSSRDRALAKRQAKLSGTGEPLEFVQVDMDQFHAISDWYYFAILSLADTRDFKDDPAWIAERLGIKKQDARVALERLERLRMLARDPETGKLGPTGKQFDTSTDIANISLRKHHYQNLELARRSLDRDPIQERDFSYMNMAVDPAKLPEIKKRVREFRNELCAEFERGARKEVYKMCIQIFPLTKSPESTESEGESV
jgi:uncharacterized protein (TIGR02147 family)